ncbi:MAG: hypothetical protein IT427_08685 [Pirellulales bacterium]|nr:hypothetical protein [Pirellulales bacterium]
MAASVAVGAIGPPRPNDQFMVGLYSVSFPADLAQAAADGFNVVHTYSFRNASGTQNPSYLTADQYVQLADSYGLSVMFQLGVLVASEPDNPMPTAVDVQHYSQYDNIVMWSVVPEESSNFQYLDNAYTTIHANDPLDRPVFMYQQTAAALSDMQLYPPVVDVIGSGLYANYAWEPRPWVRWRVEQMQQAIALNGDPPGRFVMSLPQLFPPESPEELPMTMADAYHDAWLSVVTGAKAVMVFSGPYRGALPNVYQGYKKFAGEINDASEMGNVFLDGAVVDALKPTITSGPQYSAAFTTAPNSSAGTVIQYESITRRVMAHDGRIYLAAVNSAESPVTADFVGIRTPGSNQAEVLYQNRNVGINNQVLSDAFGVLGVNVYRLPAAAELIVREETFANASAWTPYYSGGSIATAGGIATVSRGTAATQYFLRSLTAGTLPAGGFLELKVNAPSGTSFYLELVAPDGSSAALIPWQSGIGDWQVVRADFDGAWKSSSALWLGIRGGASYQVESLGVYFAALSLPSIPGDFDSDGDVDGADFVAWQTNFPKANGGTLETGDADGDGDVDGADFVVWQTNFPFTPGLSAVAVPEPPGEATMVMLLAATIALSRFATMETFKGSHCKPYAVCRTEMSCEHPR